MRHFFFDELKNFAVRLAVAHGLAGLFRLNVFAGLANERPQLLRIGVGVAAQPVAQGAVFGNQFVAPLLGQVQRQRELG